MRRYYNLRLEQCVALLSLGTVEERLRLWPRLAAGGGPPSLEAYTRGIAGSILLSRPPIPVLHLSDHSPASLQKVDRTGKNPAQSDTDPPTLRRTPSTSDAGRLFASISTGRPRAESGTGRAGTSPLPSPKLAPVPPLHLHSGTPEELYICPAQTARSAPYPVLCDVVASLEGGDLSALDLTRSACGSVPLQKSASGHLIQIANAGWRQTLVSMIKWRQSSAEEEATRLLERPDAVLHLELCTFRTHHLHDISLAARQLWGEWPGAAGSRLESLLAFEQDQIRLVEKASSSRHTSAHSWRDRAWGMSNEKWSMAVPAEGYHR